MDRAPATERLSASVAAWAKLLNISRVRRLDPDTFASYLPYHFDKHPLPPIIIADLLLRATERYHDSLDPRFPLYLKALLNQRRVDAPVVLRALFKYSSIHNRVPSQADGALTGEGLTKEVEEQFQKQQIVRFRNSYADEESILWRLAQLVHQGRGITTPKKVIQVTKVLIAWMRLFTEAAAAFSRDAFHGLQARDETEDSRNAFVLFMVAFSESSRVRHTLGKPVCKGRDAC